MRMKPGMRRLTAGALAALMLLTAPCAQAAEGVVDTRALVLRQSPSQDSKALQTLPRGEEVTVRSATGDWYRVTYGKFTGYVMKKYLKVTGKVDQEAPPVQTMADLGGAPATSRPGDTGSHVKKLQQALKLKGHYTGKLDGIYGSGTTAAVKAFQKKHGLSRDGIAGKVTIRLLFGENAANVKTYETEALRWFRAPNTIPKGATVTIQDVYTGKTFRAVRWSGSNHMDTEPASRADTAIMKAIYGGSWSWRRRPILVKYNGHVYAASMNGMPHGTTTIDNGFDGHFCIHFTDSRTHETDRVDDDHQACVRIALNHQWK